MKTKLCWVMSAAALMVLMVLAACHQASAPSTVQDNVASARQDAEKSDAKAVEQQAKTDASANTDAAEAEQKADVKKADSAYDVAVTEAEGRHKIALQKCDVLSGDAQKACKEQADAELDLAKANAKAARAAAQS